MTPLIEARNIHTYYGASHILHGLSLSVNPGETICLLGRNGMGKTTFFRSLMQLTPSREGEVLVRGQKLKETHEIARLGIAYVPENRGIFPNLSVRENLLMAARTGYSGRNNWNFERIMAVFPRLHERLGNMGGQLSGGEQQMLTIARALMTNPDLILLDEATEGLAPLIRKDIWRIIKEIKEDGIATIVVDKDLKALLPLTERALIMLKGVFVFQGQSRELLENPSIHERFLGV